jgi:hypothetical protein
MATTDTTTDTTTTLSGAELTRYLTERTSGDADAPNRRVPFITGDVLRVHSSDWTAWLAAQGLEVPKRDALAVLKDAGLAQTVYALPGEEGKSAGFYTGPAPAGTEELPRRVVERAQGRPRSPFGRLTDEQRALLVKALGKLTAERDQVLRDQLLAHLDSAA